MFKKIFARQKWILNCPYIFEKNFWKIVFPFKQTLSIILSIWDHRYNAQRSRISRETESVVSSPSTPSSSYTDLMAQFAPYASLASRDERVFDILQDSLRQLRSTCSTPNPRMPHTHSLRGRLSVHPANNVPLGGRPKNKRVYKCSVCGATGHNKATCPRELASK